MPELSEYEVTDERGNTMTVQLTEDDAEKMPSARKVGGRSKAEGKPEEKPPASRHEPVRNRARR